MNYKAKVIRIVDGDTLEATIDLGFSIFYTAMIRIYGINAPEMKGESKPLGEKSKARLKELLEGKDVTVEYKCNDKYGRRVAVIILDDKNIGDIMIQEGLAETFMVSRYKYSDD